MVIMSKGSHTEILLSGIFDMDSCVSADFFYSSYCKPTFIRVRDIFAKFANALSLRIFLAANRSLKCICLQTTDRKRLDRKNYSSRTSLFLMNREMKLSRIIKLVYSIMMKMQSVLEFLFYFHGYFANKRNVWL